MLIGLGNSVDTFNQTKVLSLPDAGLGSTVGASPIVVGSGNTVYFQHDESAGSATILIVKPPNTDRQDAGPGITFPQVVDRSNGNRGC